MNTPTLIATAVANCRRSGGRTALTSAAIVIGAFTLTLTAAAGSGITTYIDSTTAALGGDNVLRVTHAQAEGDGPQRYDSDSTLQTTAVAGPPGTTATIEAITKDDLTDLREVDGVLSAEPVLSVSPDYISHDDGRPYQLQVTPLVTGTALQLAQGDQLDNNSDVRQIALPESYLDPLDLEDVDDPIGQPVTLGLTDADGEQSKLTATVVAVSRPGLGATDAAAANSALMKALYDRQSTGLSSSRKQSYPSAIVTFDAASTDADITGLKTRLDDLGYEAETTKDQLGDFRAVITTVVLILNGFAVIALLAAGVGIVNTLLMSVKERTREIGLWKAMGLGAGRIFGLFSIEAAVIGLLGSVVGVGLAVILGSIVNAVLARSVLADLAGLTLLSFQPETIGLIFLLVLAIALVAGAVPAVRAARQDPIDSLRYE